MSLVIPPTTGRRVLLFVQPPQPSTDPNSSQAPGPAVYNEDAPFDAGIAYIWNIGDTESTINVGYVDHAGIARSATSVRLLDRAQNDDDHHGREGLGNYAVWMPYQFQQAQRASQPKDQPNPMATRPGDINLDERKLADGDQLTDLGRERAGDPPASLPRAEGLGEDATGEQRRQSYDRDIIERGAEAA